MPAPAPAVAPTRASILQPLQARTFPPAPAPAPAPAPLALALAAPAAPAAGAAVPALLQADLALQAAVAPLAARRPPEDLLELIPPPYRGAWLVGDSEAELSAWRAARRARFPTAAAVAARAAEAALRVERGAAALSAGRRGQPAAAAAAAAAVAPADAAPPPPSPPLAKRARPDGDEDASNGAGEKAVPIELQPVLAELARGAALPPPPPPPPPMPPPPPPARPPAHRGQPPEACRYFLLGTCYRGAGCPQSHGAAAQERVDASRRHLLGRLLKDEVARETDALLQCLRYVVRNDFFDEAPADGERHA